MAPSAIHRELKRSIIIGPREVPPVVPSLRHLALWAYLALGFALLATVCVLVYGLYSCCRSTRSVESQLAKEAKEASEQLNEVGDIRRPRFKSGSMGSQKTKSSSLTIADLPRLATVSELSLSSGTGRLDLIAAAVEYLADIPEPPPLFIPALLLPDTAFPHHMRVDTLFDTFNIRFVPPKTPFMSQSAAMIWNEPKLSPVHGSIIPVGFPDGGVVGGENRTRRKRSDKVKRLVLVDKENTDSARTPRSRT